MSKNDLARYLTPDLPEARLERQYAVIAARLEQPRSFQRAWLSFVTAAVVVGILIFLARGGKPEATDAPSELATLETNAESQALTLADGSRIEAARNTKLILGEISTKAVRLGLDHGKVDCDVTHRDGRDFVVVAGAYEVRVVGTRFSVERANDGIVVVVSRGAVEVRRDGDAPRRVAAGETWTAGDREPSAIPEPKPTDSASATPPPVESSSGASKVAAAETAKQLFDRAQRARAQGRLGEARDAFLLLRTRYPNDARASLAAFELARLELDDKGDALKASKLLDSTIENTPPGSPLREDAEARRVEALERAGNRGACRAARNAFLARYPTSVHRARVQSACPNP